MLLQTKDVYDRLRAVGLKRGEFFARCERLMNGATFCGYGDVRITLLCPMQRQYELAERLAQDFRVVQYFDEEQGRLIGGIAVYERGRGLETRGLHDE
jgi:hypothetical protein